MESPEDLPPAALRRRATKTVMEHTQNTTRDGDVETPENHRRRSSVGLKPPPLAEPDQASLSVENHGPFVPYIPIRARSSTALSSDRFTSSGVRAYISSLQVPTSTLDEFEYLLLRPSKGKETQYDPFRGLLRAIHDDTISLVDIIRVSLRRIREGTLDEDLMQRRVTFWRSLLHQMNFSLAELEQRLQEFVNFGYHSDVHPLSLDQRGELPSEILAKDTQQSVRSCMDLIDKSSDSLRAEMQIVDSRRSIAEAESVSKLTELAFVFIPLSFVASLFSMQVHELEGGVPLYRFALVAIAFVLVAYAVRLSIRSSRLIEYKNRTFNQIRDEAQLQYNEPIPTHTFLAWLGNSLAQALADVMKKVLIVSTPLVLVLAAVAAILSPIVLLWLRGIDKGFTAVMTILLLLFDVGLVYPVVTNTAGELSFDPKSILHEIQRNRRMNRKKKEKAKKRRKMKTGLDLEILELDLSDSSDDDESNSSWEN